MGGTEGFTGDLPGADGIVITIRACGHGEERVSSRWRASSKRHGKITVNVM